MSELTGAAWVKYTLQEQHLACERLSLAAEGLDHRLARVACMDAAGDCSIDRGEFKDRCLREGLDPKVMWGQLSRAGRWARHETDESRLVCLWMRALRGVAVAAIEQKRHAGQRSAAVRAAKKAARGGRPKRARHAETSPRKPLSDNALNDRSTSEPQEVKRTATAVPSEQAVAVPAPDAAAGRGVATAAPVADEVESPERAAAARDDAMRELLRTMVADASPLALAAEIGAQACLGSACRLEDGLLRACSLLQTTAQPAGHQPLLAEIRGLLTGEGGRAGLVAPSDAARALALALHALSQVRSGRTQPLALRALVVEIARAVPATEPPELQLRHAVTVHAEMSSGRRRTGLAHVLPSDAAFLEEPRQVRGVMVRR